ncbi:DUF4426 domain-containing protein [Amphritea sp. HPY]|uniref:DUF4426 domain-containing protein n=1 Tax=Amphritea sp. HPY TaxID=3421652 RepID=UPI003D7D916E
MWRGHIFLKYLLILLTVVPFVVQAERKQDFGDYVVHYNVFQTDMLDPKVTETYGIKRSRHRALMNIVVQKKIMGTSVQPLRAVVTSEVRNLIGQERKIKMREVQESNAIYYLGELGVQNQDMLDFSVQVRPEGSDQTLSVKFRQTFYIDK